MKFLPWVVLGSSVLSYGSNKTDIVGPKVVKPGTVLSEKATLSRGDDISFQREEFEKLLTGIMPKILEVKGKDIILFLGPTGSGKSTTINYLQGSSFKKLKKGTKKYLEVAKAAGKVAKIGHSYQSQTLAPEFFWNEELNAYFADFPGFFDNRGMHVEMVTGLVNFLTMKNARSIKGVIITSPLGAITGERGAGAKKLLDLVTQIIPNYQKYPSNLLMAITKAPEDIDADAVLEEVQELESATQNADLIAFLKHMQAFKENVFMVHPMEGKDQNSESREQLLSNIKLLKPEQVIPKEAFRFGASDQVISHFKAMILRLAKEGQEALNSYYSITNSLQERGNELQDLNQEKSLLEGTFLAPEDQKEDKVTENLKSLIEQSTHKIEELDQEIQDLMDKKEKQEAIIIDCNSKHYVEFWSKEVPIPSMPEKKSKFSFKKGPSVKQIQEERSVTIEYRGIGPIVYRESPSSTVDHGIWSTETNKKGGGETVWKRKYTPFDSTTKKVKMTVDVPHNIKPSVIQERKNAESQRDFLKDLIKTKTALKKETQNTLDSQNSLHVDGRIEKERLSAVLEALHDRLEPLNKRLAEIKIEEPELKLALEKSRSNIWKTQRNHDFVIDQSSLFEFKLPAVSEFLEAWNTFKTTEKKQEVDENSASDSDSTDSKPEA